MLDREQGFAYGACCLPAAQGICCMTSFLSKVLTAPCVHAASKSSEQSAEEAGAPTLPLPSPVPAPEEALPKPDDNPFAGLLNSCAPFLPLCAAFCVHAEV